MYEHTRLGGQAYRFTQAISYTCTSYGYTQAARMFARAGEKLVGWIAKRRGRRSDD
jgi:hypothetical protein